MTDPRTQLIRTATKRLDTLHAATYFSPIMVASIAEVGLERSAQYFAARSCALGPASAELVAATFFSFSPAKIALAVPACWETTSPAEVHEARMRGVREIAAELLRQLHTAGHAEQVIASANRLNRGVHPVLEAQPVSGRALYAAHRSILDQEFRSTDHEDPLVALWVTITLLREFRGDGHIAALVTQGLTGLEASVLDCATGKAWRPTAARRSRGWTEDEWRTVACDLVERGLLTDTADTASLTEQGKELKERVERDTDASVAAAWSVRDEEQLAQVRTDAKLISEVVTAAGLLPQKFFGRDEPLPAHSVERS